MFQIREVEMVHWDFWQGIRVPLDAQIVTIVGPNGSGKTTLLDALRTLLALKCSGRRDYKRYVRNAEAPFAWLRGVVDNPRREGGGLFPYPFFPIQTERVTLLCRIRKQGGDWVRHYAILEGDVALSDGLEEQVEWLGVNEYKRRLEQAGLTAAIAEVLALEQGDTDKLCEYSPRALLDLVFQVFGDKQVLDNYQQARLDQKEAERELEELRGQLGSLGNRVEQLRGKANRYTEWKQLSDEVALLDSEVLPRMKLIEARDSFHGYHSQYKGARRTLHARQAELAQADDSLRAAQQACTAAEQAKQSAKGAYQAVNSRWQTVRDATRDTEKLVTERDRMQKLAEAESGADAVGLAKRLGELRLASNELAGQIREAKQQREQLAELQFALQGGRQPSEPFVRQMRAALDEAGIPHQMLTEIVEVKDGSWQEAVEALLAPYRHLILLNRASDRDAAWKLGQKNQYRHFIVADREATPRAVPGSILEVVELRADAPAWLTRQLNQVSRVKSVEDGARLDGDWITRDGFHKERRGARHIGVDARDHRFGEASRLSRLDQVSRALRDLNDNLLKWESRQVELGRDVSALQLQLAGMDAVQQLAARQEEFAAAEARLPELQAESARIGAELAEAMAQQEAANEQHTSSLLALQKSEGLRDQLLRQVDEQLAQAERQRAEQSRLIATIRSLKSGLAPETITEDALQGLKAKWKTTAAVHAFIEIEQTRLAQGDWETDPTLLERRDKLQEDYNKLAREVDAHQREVERAAELTGDARGAYINKLRATVRAYGRNVKRLGELAGIGVEVEMPHLENDDVILAQAGLAVRFDFDQKGLMGMNDGEASGGQQVMKSLVLLIGLMMDESNPTGFVFIDEPFAHLDIFNIDRVSSFLKATQAQYLITTPLTHNLNVYAPSELTLNTRKKQPGERWAPLITQVRRRVAGTVYGR